jgi:hypothetical protein
MENENIVQSNTIIKMSINMYLAYKRWLDINQLRCKNLENVMIE